MEKIYFIERRTKVDEADSESRRKPLRVLLTSNIVLPAIAEGLGLSPEPFGGWLSETTKALRERTEMAIGVAMRAPVKSLERIEADGVIYYALPQRKFDSYDVKQSACEYVLGDFRPDILHAEGTEMAYTRRMLATWNGPNVVSLQGVINGHVRYQFGGLRTSDFLNWRRPWNLAVGVALLVNHFFRFRPRLKYERETIRQADHLVGRTLWDQAHSNWFNSRATYHHCPRMLRQPFYENSWLESDHEPCSIFISSGASPLKGAHFLLRAASHLREKYPKLRVYIAGRDPTGLPRFSLQGKLGYSVYLRNLIEDLDLKENVIFTGQLNAVQMVHRLCRIRVFVLPSLIENSPNALAEAMLLGVPSIAAYAGGAPSMARDENEVLMYRASDPVMLAFQLQRIFEDDRLCQRLSHAARQRARLVHNQEMITSNLIGIYKSIIEVSEG